MPVTKQRERKKRVRIKRKKEAERAFEEGFKEVFNGAFEGIIFREKVYLAAEKTKREKPKRLRRVRIGARV